MKLELYYRKTCPFCQKVLAYLEKENIQVTLKELPEHAEELEKIGGKQQVPCLIHDGKALYESDDIIEWFEKNKGSL